MDKFEKAFESERVVYVRLSEKLARDYMAMVNDPEVMKFIRHDEKIFTYEEELEWIRKTQEENSLVFSMIEKKTGDFIGNVGLPRENDGIKEIGICLTPKKQNKHFGSEALEAIMKYARESLGLDKVMLKVFPENERAIHVYEKAGFVRDGLDEKGDICMIKNLKVVSTSK